MKGFLLIVLFLMGCIVIAVLFSFGMGVTARREARPIERKVTKAAWRFLVPGAVKIKENPIAETPQLIRDVSQHWVDHCSLCHGNDGSGSGIGRSLHPPVPNLAKMGTQELSDGELFYAIDQGVPWTGMPAWGTGTAESDRDIWALVLFIRSMPKFTPADRKAIEKLSVRTPAVRERDRRIDEFLRGGKNGSLYDAVASAR